MNGSFQSVRWKCICSVPSTDDGESISKVQPLPLSGVLFNCLMITAGGLASPPGNFGKLEKTSLWEGWRLVPNYDGKAQTDPRPYCPLASSYLRHLSYLSISCVPVAIAALISNCDKLQVITTKLYYESFCYFMPHSCSTLFSCLFCIPFYSERVQNND